MHTGRSKWLTTVISGVGLATMLGTAHAATPAQNCQSAKNKAVGKYSGCRQKAEAKFATSLDGAKRTADLVKCEAKYQGTWPGLEAKAVAQGGACPSVGDQSAIQGAVDQHTGNIATALAGGVLQDCSADLLTCQGSLGTCNGGLTTCTGNLGTCTGDLGTCNSSLTTTQGNLTTCTGSLGTCNTNLATTQTSLTSCNTNLTSTQSSLTTCTGSLGTCTGNLTTCQNDLTICQAAPQGQRLKTGQTLCYNASGTVIACAGTGQDGQFQKGLARSYTDNGNGTITDNKTGLMWEKISDDGSIHDKDTTYTWTTAVTTKIAALNSGSFAGFTDWRLPNVNELQSLANYGAFGPAVFSAFNTSCAASCTVLTCSCTSFGNYWSSSTFQSNSNAAWGVVFFNGDTDANGKTFNFYVRGVRGGS